MADEKKTKSKDGEKSSTSEPKPETKKASSDPKKEVTIRRLLESEGSK